MFKKGIVSGLPIFLGYFPIAIAFGLLSKAQGVPLVPTVLFSLLVFAGASQFIALKLIGIGSGVIDIAIVTFLVNLRHMLMSAALSAKLKDRKLVPIISFGITDETFSIASLEKGEITSIYLLGLESIAYTSWILGTLSGFLMGDFLPDPIKKSMGIALYAMFIAILMPEVKKSHKVLIISGTGALVNTVIWLTKIVNPGIGIVISIIVGASLGLILFEDEIK